MSEQEKTALLMAGIFGGETFSQVISNAFRRRRKVELEYHNALGNIANEIDKMARAHAEFKNVFLGMKVGDIKDYKGKRVEIVSLYWHIDKYWDGSMEGDHYNTRRLGIEYYIRYKTIGGKERTEDANSNCFRDFKDVGEGTASYSNVHRMSVVGHLKRAGINIHEKHGYSLNRGDGVYVDGSQNPRVWASMKGTAARLAEQGISGDDNAAGLKEADDKLMEKVRGALTEAGVLFASYREDSSTIHIKASPNGGRVK